MKKSLVILLCLSCWTIPGFALQSDSSKPIEIAADRFTGDQIQQTAVYTGNVEVRQGSIQIRGDRLELRITPKGYRVGTMTGRLARFKQQRDNKDPKISEWVHAEAEQLIYNEETDSITLRNRARLSRTENGELRDEATGQSITYDIRNARSQVLGGTVSGQHQRVTTIIAPRKKTPVLPSAGNPIPLQPAPDLGSGKKE